MRREPLTRGKVLEAALALVDREGIEALTMRRLGRAVGVEAMSLYNHVRDKEDLLDGLVGLLASEVALPEPEVGDWAERIAELVRRYRRLAHAHPHAFPLIALRPLNTPEALRPIEWAFAVAHEAGIGPEATLLMFRVLASYANGYVLNELQAAFTLDEGPGRLTPERLPAEEFPHLAALGPVVARRSRDEEFEHGLTLIVAALRAGTEGS